MFLFVYFFLWVSLISGESSRTKMPILLCICTLDICRLYNYKRLEKLNHHIDENFAVYERSSVPMHLNFIPFLRTKGGKTLRRKFPQTQTESTKDKLWLRG